MIIAQNAPLAAAIQAGMLRGTIPADDTIVRLCDSVLDRIMGKARQQIDVFANSEGLKRLDAYATWLQVQRGEPPQIISAEVKELPESAIS
jgi:N-acyl-L-homoserine lactone synthetase